MKNDNKKPLINEMKLSVHFRQPFSIFEIEDFLDPAEYSEAFDQFPMETGDYQESGYGNVHGKTAISTSSTPMINIKKRSAIWGRLFARFSSNEMLPVLRLAEEANDKPPGTYVLVSVNPITNLINKMVRGKTLLFTTFEFSLLRPTSKVLPHTDSANKVVTMLLYFPEPEQNGRVDLGTAFYHFPCAPPSKYENSANQFYTKGHFPDYYEDCKILFQTPFVKQHIFGFIRSAFSWHAVPEIQPGAGEARRLFAVNLRLFQGGIFSPAIDLLKMKIKAVFQK